MQLHVYAVGKVPCVQLTKASQSGAIGNLQEDDCRGITSASVITSASGGAKHGSELDNSAWKELPDFTPGSSVLAGKESGPWLH